MPSTVETKGRCEKCRKIYQWAGKPKLSCAQCCGLPLQRCKLLDAGVKVFQAPASL